MLSSSDRLPPPFINRVFTKVGTSISAFCAVRLSIAHAQPAEGIFGCAFSELFVRDVVVFPAYILYGLDVMEAGTRPHCVNATCLVVTIPASAAISPNRVLDPFLNVIVKCVCQVLPWGK